jgi:hypothetical protein
LLLTAAANGAVLNLNAAVPLNAVALAVLARNAAIAIADYLATNFGAPNYLRRYGVAVQAAATAIDQTGVSGALAAGAAQAAGAAVTNACASLYANLSPVQHLAATTAATAASNAVPLTPNSAALAKTARDSLHAVAALQFKTHIRQELSSLKTPNAATSVDYRSHAFDHFVTNGFDDESASGVVDVVGTDPGFLVAAAAGGNTFLAFIRRIGKANGSGQEGISDHMPVRITITLN